MTAPKQRPGSYDDPTFARRTHRKPVTRTDIPGPYQMEAFEERAAMFEFDAHMTREAAEKMAWDRLFGTRFLQQTYLEFTKEIDHARSD